MPNAKCRMKGRDAASGLSRVVPDPISLYPSHFLTFKASHVAPYYPRRMKNPERPRTISLLLLALLFCADFSPAQTTGPTTLPAAQWVNPQPEIPYLPKPATRPADWVVPHDPVTPGASPEARALLNFLYNISGNHTLTGQHNYAAQQGYSTGMALKLSHKTPVIYGTDWGFARAGDKDSAFVREQTVRTLIEQYRKGSIIALCWHEVPPTKDEPVTFRKDVMSKLTNQQFEDVIAPGTALYQRWSAQVDVVAGYLEELQAARVPILFRPYHEMNGDWFWWGGRRGQRGTQQLYRQMFDRLVNFHHINNLLWVWDCDQPMREDRQFVDYFPGQQYVDILALDDYGRFQQPFYDEMNALSNGKVLAIAETARPPTIDIYQTQPKWAYWMRWATDRNRPATRPVMANNFAANGRIPPVPLDVIVRDPRMLSLDDAAYWQLIAPLRAVSDLPDTRPVDPGGR
jgi:mannan endo-1,4-beta-mannosidase